MASAYMGVSPTKFADRVKDSAYPPGFADGGNMLWYREDLDACLDRLRSGDPHSRTDTVDPIAALEGANVD